MVAEPGGAVTRGWLALRLAERKIMTEIVVLSTSCPVRSTVWTSDGPTKLKGSATPLTVSVPVPLAVQ